MAPDKRKLNLFSNPKTQDLIGFDYHDDQLKLVHVHVGAMKRQVMHIAQHDAHGLSENDVSAFVQETVKKWGVVKPSGYITVPLGTVITRSIEIPSRDSSEIREIVNLQASRHTPYSRAEIIIDLLELGVVRESYTKVLLVIAPKEVIVKQSRILEKAGIGASKVFFPSEGIAQACVKIIGADTSDKVTAIVHMDTFFTTFVAVQRTDLLFVRGISIGANHLLEEREIYADRFIDELHKSIESYAADDAGPAPSQLLLTGVVAEITDLDYLFSSSFTMPIKHQTYFNYFLISDEARAVAASNAKQISFFNVIAPLLLYDRMKIDLITDERRLQLQIEQRGRDLVNTGILVMVILTLLAALFGSQIFFKKTYLDSVIKRYQPVRDDAKALEQTFAKTQLVKDHLYQRGNSVETIADLYDALPKNVSVSDIRYEEGGTKFSVKGTSGTMASVFTFVTNLEKSQHFKNVKTKYVTSRSENGSDVADFEIVSSIDAGNSK
jgi:Tfp pilus assembly PilM family ATPase/Tfp pilus assembly protein PilN